MARGSGALGLSWVRLDTAWPRNPKVLDLINAGHWRTLTVYIAGLCYSGENVTDGWIPTAALPFIHGTRTDAHRLCDRQLWHDDTDGDGWVINDWNIYQPSREEVVARSRRSRDAALKRWAGGKAGINGSQ